ncbi:transcription factor WRKY19-like [Miscanthus floridulus]|uniref:transcription factor WRKY19-like n=1 Tax=Miscanthus floridulus TaxID=154761 RepID=UPI00345B34BA
MATTEMEMGMGVVDGGSNNGGSSGLVVMELSHIKELVRQLKVHLGGSPDLCMHLASQILSLTERSIGLITSSNLDGAVRRKRSAGDAGLASPLSATPTSDVTDGPFKNTTKKRKVMEQRRQRVSSAGGENPVDDGHSWRKYGQKEILGAKHPRSYYRCTHRHSQGCQATKQVQRTDEDATMYDVIYHGEHTCVNRPAAVATAAPAEHNPDADAHLQTLSEGLPAAATPLYLSTSTPPASGGGCQLAPSTTSENWGVSPATSDSNNHVASYLPFEDAEWRGHAELQEVVSALVAASAPPPAVDSFDDLLIDIDIASFFA